MPAGPRSCPPSTSSPPPRSFPVGSAGVDQLLTRVDQRLAGFIGDEARRWCRLDPELDLGFRLLSEFIAGGGKRLRPRFCLLGFLGHIDGGRPATHLEQQAVDLAAAVEMLHTFALIHDDVMDGSSTRRHQPTVHASVAGVHQGRRWRGEQRRVSEGLAVLIGDLAFVYADRLMAGMPAEVVDLFDEMRIELHVGQYLDMLGAATGGADPERANRVIQYKTAAYSVIRPLLMGASLAGGGVLQRDQLTRYGQAVGDAFQLRDDLLGLFGPASDTGKSSDDDLREGKATLLLALTRSWAEAGADRALLTALSRVGRPGLSPDDADAIRRGVIVSGARDRVERRIAADVDTALDAVTHLQVSDPIAAELASLARFCAWRSA